MYHLIFEESPPWTVRPRRKTTHTEHLTSINQRVFKEEFQRETQKNQESKSKDIEQVSSTPFHMFSARVPPEEKETCKNLPPPDARGTTQGSVAALSELLPDLLGKVESLASR